MSHKDGSTIGQRPRDRLIALIGLTSQERKQTAVGISQEKLQQFYAGKLSEQESEKVFAYLDQNPDAMEQWMSQAAPQSRGIAGRLLSGFSSLLQMPGFKPVGLGASVAAAMVVGLVWFSSAPVEHSSEITGQQHALAEAPALDAEVEFLVAAIHDHRPSTVDIALPWEQQGQGYRGFSPARDQRLAEDFGLGLKVAKMQLQDKSISAEPAIAKLVAKGHSDTYLSVGRWNYTLSHALLSELAIPTSFWDKQIDTVMGLSQALDPQNEDDLLVIKSLEMLQPALSEIASNPESKRTRSKLVKQLVLQRLSLSPADEPKTPVQF